MGNLKGYEWLIILLIVLVLFGGAKLPQLARSFGKSARILREEMKGSDTEDGDKGTGAVTRDTDDDGDKPRG